MNRKFSLFYYLFLSMLILTSSIWSECNCLINFEEQTLSKAKKCDSLNDLYSQTKDPQVAVLIKEVSEITSEVEDIWREYRKRVVIFRDLEDDADIFLESICWKKDFGLEWHQENFDIIKMTRNIFNEHPCLKQITIIKDAMIIYIHRHSKGIIFSYNRRYFIRDKKQCEINKIEKNSIKIISKGDYLLNFSNTYEPDIFELVSNKIFFICDKNDSIIEMRTRQYKSEQK